MSATPAAAAPPAPTVARPVRTVRVRRALAKLRHPSRRFALVSALLLGLLATPRLIELALPRIVDALARNEIGLRVAIGRVDIDLATMTVRARDVSARPAEGGPLLASLQDVTVVLAPRRILEGIVIERIDVDEAYAAGRLRNGELDWVEAIVAARRKKPDTPPSDLPGFLIERITLEKVHVTLDDGKRRHEIDLSAVAHDVGTLAGRPGRAFVRGSGASLRRLAVAGELDLQASTQSITADVQVSGLDLGLGAAFLPGVAASGHELDFAGRARVTIERDGPLASRVTLRVEDTAAAADGRPDLRVGRAEWVFGFELDKPPFLRTARFADTSVALERDAGGTLHVLGLVGAPPEEGRPSRDSAPSLPEIPFDVATVSRCSVRLRDRLTAGEPEVRLDDIHAEVHAPRWMHGRTIGARVAASAPGLASHLELVASGSHVASAYELSASFVAEDLDPAVLDAYLAPSERRFGPKGHFEASLEAVTDEEKGRGLRAQARLVDAELRDERGPRLRASDVQLALDWTADGLELESLRGNLWTTVTRASDGSLTVAGFPPATPDPKRPVRPARAAREPGIEVRLGDLALGIGIHYADEARATWTDASLDARARGLVLGPRPARGSFSLRGAAPGLARSIAVEGRLLPSAVTPSLDLALALDLEPGVLDAYLEPLGWKALLLHKRLALEASLERNLADPANRTTRARVSNLVLADSEGVGASVDEVAVELRETADPALLEVPLVAISHPRLAVDETGAGLVVARTFIRSRPASAEPGVAARRPRRRAVTTRIQEIRIRDGEADVTSATGPPIAVRGLQVHAGPLEVGPGAVRSLVLEATGSAPGVVRSFAVKGSLARPVDLPTVSLSVVAEGIDLEPLRARASGAIARATVHDGRFHATFTGRFAPLREGGFAALVTVSDLSLVNDEGREIVGLGELRARIVRFDPATLDIDLSSVEIDRPRLDLARTRDARLEVAGVVTVRQFLGLSDEERRLGVLGLLPPETGKKPLVSRPGPPGRTPRITIDHASLADADVRLRDSGTLDDQGHPLTFHAVDIEGTADRFALGGLPGPPAPLRFETELRFEDGMRAALDGVVALGEDGIGAGRIEGELRGLSLPTVSRYAENAAGVSLRSGDLDGAAGLELRDNTATGEIEVTARHLRISRLGDDPLQFVGSKVAMTLLTDWQGDTTVTIPVKDNKVGGGALFRMILRELILSTLGQPFRVLLAIPERATGEAPRDWLRWLLGKTLPAEVQEDAFFSPGDARLTLEGARAVSAAAFLVSERGGRQIRVRAECTPGDRTRARRAASLAPTDVKDLVARLEAGRARQEALGRDLAACERVALAEDDADRAVDARRRLLAVEAAIADLDRSEGELAERVEYEDTVAVTHARAEEALRRLAAERVETIRRALGAAGVDEKLVRVLPARIHGADEQARAPGGGGRVTIVVAP